MKPNYAVVSAWGREVELLIDNLRARVLAKCTYIDSKLHLSTQCRAAIPAVHECINMYNKNTQYAHWQGQRYILHILGRQCASLRILNV